MHSDFSLNTSFTTAARRQTAPPHHTHNFCWHGPRQRSHGEGNRYLYQLVVGTRATSGVELWRRRDNPKGDGCYLSTDRHRTCLICTSNSSTSTVASLSLPTSLSVSLFKDTSHNNIAISLPALLFFRSYNEVFVQTAFIPYYLSTDIDFVRVLCTSGTMNQ